MATRLYYGSPRSPACQQELTIEDLPPDGDFYYDDEDRELAVDGIRLTREPTAWPREYLLLSVDVPLDASALAPYRVAWDWKHESYDLPVDTVNAARRRWVRDAETVILMSFSARSRGVFESFESFDEYDDLDEHDGEAWRG